MVAALAAVLTGFSAARAGAEEHPAGADAAPYPMPAELAGVDLAGQTAEEAAAKSTSCIHCHQGAHDPHDKPTVRLGCTDCHGGDATKWDKVGAHVHPRLPDAWQSSANPVRSYTLLNHERPDFIRFVNPGDLRVAHMSCGMAGCHPKEVLQVRKSMMTHGCMLWGAALYNNGGYPLKRARFGESYSMHGVPQRLQTVPPPTQEEIEKKGVVPFLDPLPRYEISQPGNILRIFERGGRFVLEPGNPERLEEPGRPRTRLSIRGLGTGTRTDPVFVGLNKTRLLDPTLNFLGTNDHPGDFRSSGCTACHMVYANDRSPVHSGPYAGAGHLGFSRNSDPTIPRHESGHPIEHRLTMAIPTSQCIICHIHPGTSTMNSYTGFQWWDLETDGEHMYPKEHRYLTAEQLQQAQFSDPNDAAARGLWSDPDFLARVSELNPKLRHTQFADFHGHGWCFRAVFRTDRQGRRLDYDGNPLEAVSAQDMQRAVAFQEKGSSGPRQADRAGVPVHYKDIHIEKGMHCIDCHFVQDVHGNAKLYQEVRAACEIQCIDCHGTLSERATLRTSGPAAAEAGPGAPPGRDLAAMRTPFGRRRFERRGEKLIQHSMVEPDLSWEVVQTRDTIDPSSPRYNAKSALAKTVRFREGWQPGEPDPFVWGDLPGPGQARLAHCNQQMSCIACHSSWNPSCYGCHLPQRANKKTPHLHWEGDVTRNYVSYNFQTLRDEVYMLARDGDVTGNRIGPARSSCAISVGSYNQNREQIYVGQQTISADGLSGIAFSTNVPHTVRGRDGTKQCSDCHLSVREDNNALMAQLLMHGTNYLNFIGRWCWVAAGEHGFEAVAVTEQEEPQAVIGSTLHQLAFPDFYCEHQKRGRKLEVAHEHPGKDILDNVRHPLRRPEVLRVQARGEYLYAACGHGGLRVFDVAFIDNKAFSERITTAPVSPLGQRFYVKTACATDVAAPTTIAPDPTRNRNPENGEPAVHAIYGYLFVADKEEGLILVGAGTLLDGNPTNNFLERAVTFNPGGLLDGARRVVIVGTYAYVCCDAGLVVVSLDDPEHPKVTSVLGGQVLDHPVDFQAQFRYGFVCDCQGVKVLDITDLAHPKPVAGIDLPESHGIYVARTRAYVAGGKEGLIILDVTNPLEPKVEQVYNAGGKIDDVHDVKLGIAYASLFAYLADGKNGLRVVQLTSPETPGNEGFSPRPTPHLIATKTLPHGGHALAISEGVDRDRAVDESGNPIAVFGRIGARALSLEEQRRLYLRDGQPGQPWRVSDDPRDPMYGPRRPLWPPAPPPPGRASVREAIHGSPSGPSTSVLQFPGRASIRDPMYGASNPLSTSALPPPGRASIRDPLYGLPSPQSTPAER